MQGRLSSLHKNRAENGVRTRDLRLGKPTLYQLSYFRKSPQSMGGTANITIFIIIAKILTIFGRQIRLLVQEPLDTALRSLGKRLKTEFV